MKGIVITPSGDVSERDFGEPLYKTVGEAIGGLMEIVKPKGLPEPLVMIANEEGRLQNLPFNPIASYWYGTQRHGQPIVGTVVILREDFNAEHEPDLFGLDEYHAALARGRIDLAKRAKLPEDPHNPPPRAQVYTLGEFDDLLSLFDLMPEPERVPWDWL